MITTFTIEFVGDTEQHLKVLEHELKHIHDVDVDLVEPRDHTAPVLLAIGVNKGGERGTTAIQSIAQVLYNFLHSGTATSDDKKIYLVTAEGNRVDIEPLPSDEINTIISTAYEGEGDYAG
ncbi:MAG: hypothetical protein H0V70_19870 [Ktedonobacteraceae bacterium]|nr:hypothetical protein [Ktedonobacteraceae bacterium]